MATRLTHLLTAGAVSAFVVVAPGALPGWQAGAAAPAAPPTCAGEPATIVGTPGDDFIDGTDGRDVIVARGGDDHVGSGPGRDLICLGAGDDLGDGHDGQDQVRGGAGDDYLVSHRGYDRIVGNRGRDVMFLPSRRGTDVEGGPGDDAITVNPSATGRLNARGGSGWDQIGLHVGGRDAAILIDQQAGTIDLAGTAGAFSGFAYVNLTGRHAWTYDGTAAADTLVSLQGPTTTHLRGGDDRVWTGDFDDWIDGGGGHDTAIGIGDGINYCVALEEVESGVCAAN